MNIFTRMRLAMAGASLKMAGLSIVPQWVRATWLEPSWDRLVGDAYRSNSAFLACVSRFAFAFPEPSLLPFSEEGEAGEAQLDHPLRLLLRRPNPRMGEHELLATTISYLALGGNAYWHKVRNNSGQVIRLWPYHVGQLLPVPGGDDWITHYEYIGDGRKTVVPLEDILHFRWPLPDPDQPWMGLAPIIAAAREVDTDNEARRYVYALLKNDAVPRLALEMPEHIAVDDDMERRLKAQWRAKYGGDNRGDVAILTGGAKISRVGQNMNELAYDALSQIPESRIAAVMGVPAILAGLNVGLAHATFANYGEARRAFTEDTLSPLWQIFASEVDNSLTPDFDASLDVRFDLSKVKALSENTDALWKRVNEAAKGGVLQLNEARTALGYDAVPTGDVFLWELNPGFSPGATPLSAEGAAPKMLATGHRHKASNPATDRRNAQRLQRIRLAVVENMADGVDDYFNDLTARVVKRAGGKAKADTLPGLDDLLLQADEDELKALFSKFYTELLQASWSAWGGMLDDETPFSLKNPAVERILETSGQNVKDITETTKQSIQDVLVRGRDQGWSIQQLVDGVGDLPGLRSVVEETYKGRAQTIARTELGTAQNSASVVRYRAAGRTHVKVFDGGGGDSDDICNGLNNTVQTMDWAEANPLQHPNCVRAFAPYFE